jgi:hypothetical protein
MASMVNQGGGRYDPAELVGVDLSEDERRLLQYGLSEWGGPARCTEELARAMGFLGVEDLFAEGDRLRTSIAAGEPLSRLDWCRTLLATEIVFVSNVMGSGRDWSVTTGISDAETLETLRQVQSKLTREAHVKWMIGRGLGTRDPDLPAHP